MFKKGDKVKIIGGYFKGKIGTVTTVYNVFDKLEGNDMVLVEFDVFTSRHFFVENLELVSTDDTQIKRLKTKEFLNNLYGKNGLSSYFDTDGSHYDLESDDIMTENDLLKPNHYQTKNGDLFDEWYERYPFETFRIVLLATAERYFRRYHLKDGLDGLNKGIEVMKRLEEYELKEKNND